jgi:hypothetical protein
MSNYFFQPHPFISAQEKGHCVSFSSNSSNSGNSRNSGTAVAVAVAASARVGTAVGTSAAFAAAFRDLGVVGALMGQASFLLI